MQAMQYKVGLPADYDMEIIKKRVRTSGHKTDGFKDLLFKAYLITEKQAGNLENSYCPLYVWKDTEGMTQFIFEGFFDNIIASFGWQHIEIGVTSHVHLDPLFSKSHYVIEEYKEIPRRNSINKFEFVSNQYENMLGQVIIYNPDKWIYVTFSFFENKPKYSECNQTVYSVLHLSLA